MRSLLVVLLALPGAILAQQDFSKTEIHFLPAQGNVFMLVGAGGNITVQAGKDGVLIVDTQFAPLSGKILDAIKKLSDQPLRYIVNTHYHGDHTGGNEPLRKAGSTIAGGNVAGDLGAAASEGAQIIAHDNVAKRMSAPTGQQAPALTLEVLDVFKEGIRLLASAPLHLGRWLQIALKKGGGEGPPAWRLVRVVWSAPVGGGHYCVGALFDKPLSGPTLQALTSA